MTTDVQRLDTFGSRLQNHVAALVGSPWFWILFIGTAATVPFVRAIRTPLPPPLPVLSTVPAFELTDQYGHTFGSDELRGKVWIANAVFTRCPTVCPGLTK